jgi:hypothetical protein
VTYLKLHVRVFLVASATFPPVDSYEARVDALDLDARGPYPLSAIANLVERLEEHQAIERLRAGRGVELHLELDPEAAS